MDLCLDGTANCIIRRTCGLSFVGSVTSDVKGDVRALTNIARGNFSSANFCINFLLLVVLIIKVCITCAKLVGQRADGTLRTIVGFIIIFILSTSFVTCTPSCVGGVGRFSSSVDATSLSLKAGVVLPGSSDRNGSDIRLVQGDLFSVRIRRP